MGCRGRPIFDLNELPTEGEDVNDDVVCINPQKTIPTSNFNTTSLFPPSESSRIANNNAFKHASSVSGFQPFVRYKDQQDSKEDCNQKQDESKPTEAPPSISGSHAEDNNAAQNSISGALDAQDLEREEGEWSDMDAETDGTGNNSSDKQDEVDLGNVSKPEATEEKVPDSVKFPDSNSHDSIFHGNSNGDSGDMTTNDPKSSVVLVSDYSRNLDSGFKGHAAADGTEEPSLPVKPKDIKGVEASHTLRVGSNLGRRSKLDEHKEAMLGKKRARQTMFINVEDAKQAGSIKTSTPRRQSSFPAPMITRTVKDTHRPSPAAVERIAEHHHMCSGKDQKQSDTSNTEEGAAVDSGNQKVDSNVDYSSGSQAWSKKPNVGDFNMDAHPVSMPRQGSLKQPMDSRQSKSFPVLQRKPTVGGQSIVDHKAGSKKHLPAKKQTADNFQYQDTSVERLLREVTNEKFWHQAEETELQCVPGQFESVEEYVRVFEPLLFEECRAQLYSTWEECTETVSRDAHIAVRVKTVERRERDSSIQVQLPGVAPFCDVPKEKEAGPLLTEDPSGSERKKRTVINPTDGLFYHDPSAAAFALELLRTDGSESTLRRFSDEDIADHLRLNAASAGVLVEAVAKILEEKNSSRARVRCLEADVEVYKAAVARLEREQRQANSPLELATQQCRELTASRDKLKGEVERLSQQVADLLSRRAESEKTRQILEGACMAAEKQNGSLSLQVEHLSSELVEGKKFAAAWEEEREGLLLSLKTQGEAFASSLAEKASLEEDLKRASGNLVAERENLRACRSEISFMESQIKLINSKDEGYAAGVRFGSEEGFKVIMGLVRKGLPLDYDTLTLKKGLKILVGENPDVDSEDEGTEEEGPSEGDAGDRAIEAVEDVAGASAPEGLLVAYPSEVNPTASANDPDAPAPTS